MIHGQIEIAERLVRSDVFAIGEAFFCEVHQRPCIQVGVAPEMDPQYPRTAQ